MAVKPGWKTSEFWGKTILQIGGILFLVTGKEWANPEVMEPSILGLISSFEVYYAGIRMKAKTGDTSAEPKTT